LPSDGDYLDVAIGDAVVYVAYEDSRYRLRLIRSFDLGASWSRAVTIHRDAFDASLTAEGNAAYIAFTEWFDASNNAKFMTVKYRGTNDRGASWSAAANLVRNELDADFPQILRRDGSLHATYSRCKPLWDSCDDTRTMYRRSVDGSSWSQQVRVSSFTDARLAEARPAAIGASDRRVFVLYTECHGDPVDYNLWHCRVFVRPRATPP
jgi:hypothetical protein